MDRLLYLQTVIQYRPRNNITRFLVDISIGLSAIIVSRTARTAHVDAGTDMAVDMAAASCGRYH